MAEASFDDHRQQGTVIDLSTAANMSVILSLHASYGLFLPAYPPPATDDYAMLGKYWNLFSATAGQRHLQSDELRMTLGVLRTVSVEAALEAAFDESREQLVLRGFHRPDFLQRLIEKFMASENPRSLRRVLLLPERDLGEARSASFHFTQAYDTIFPCSRCTVHRNVEVFHFTNRNDASVRATASFRKYANRAENESTVEIYLDESCRPQKAYLTRPSRKLFAHFDTFFEVLREVNPEELEKLRAVSRGWRATIDGHRRALPRRKLRVDINFYGEDPTIVTVEMYRWTSEYLEMQRTLVPRGPEQLSRMLCAHLRDALVKLRFVSCSDSHTFGHPPEDAMLHGGRSRTLAWIVGLFQSLKRTQVERVELYADTFGIDNLPVLLKAARFSCGVGTLYLNDYSSDGAPFTVRQVVDLLRDATAAASDKIVVRMRFLDAKDTTSLIVEFRLVLAYSDDAELARLPRTNRIEEFKQVLTYALSHNCYFRHNRYEQETTARVHIYRNAHTGEVLSAVRGVDGIEKNMILFVKGPIALDDLRSKWSDFKY